MQTQMTSQNADGDGLCPRGDGKRDHDRLLAFRDVCEATREENLYS